MSSTLLSVIIPTYNRACYVLDCMNALKESRVDGLEIIVADDGSTDDTREVVARVDPSAKYHWQPNTGTPSTARNEGFKLSTGKYVAFLDCDDGWLPEVPRKAVELLERYPEVDVLFADAKMGNLTQGFVSWIQEAGQQIFFDLPHREPEPGFRILERRPFLRRMAVRNPVFIGACILRREVFERSGGFLPCLRGAADWDLWLRLATRHTYGFMNEPLAIYTRHGDNMSSNMDHMSEEFCEALANTLALDSLEKEDREHIRQRLLHHRFGYAYMAYDRGDTREARKRFRQAIHAGDWSPRTLVLATTCMLPSWAVSRLRKMKRKVS